MTQQLTDDRLRRLKRADGHRAASDPLVLKLMANVVNNYRWEEIHWLTDDREDVFHDWYAKRLHRGRLAGMIDKAKSVAHLRNIAAKDLKQYAIDKLRSELPTRLFARLNKLLRSNPDRFKVMLTSNEPGSTYWTLTNRVAAAVFSDRDHELVSLVYGIGLQTLDEAPDASKQTQFISPAELDRYVYEMLESSARGLSLDQLVRGLTLAYDLAPAPVELPDENALADDPAAGAALATVAEPSVPLDDRTDAAQRLLELLTDRQVEVLVHLGRGYNQSQIAKELSCSETVVSHDMRAIREAFAAVGPPEDYTAILASAGILHRGDEHEC
jgi:DNA-binding NarL/FixJ family response regulator